jgi:hypothetical protein
MVGPQRREGPTRLLLLQGMQTITTVALSLSSWMQVRRSSVADN